MTVQNWVVSIGSEYKPYNSVSNPNLITFYSHSYARESIEKFFMPIDRYSTQQNGRIQTQQSMSVRIGI